MAQALHSPSWYRVADLTPRLRPHIEIHRHVVRGAPWHVVQDHQTGQFHRLSPTAYHALALMDGQRTVQAIWQVISARLGEDQPTQQEIVQLLAQCHSADLLTGELPPDMRELARRSERKARRTMLARIQNPMALRLPLVDPDRFLEATLPLVRPLFSVAGILAWLALVGLGLVVAALHWQALGSDVTAQLLTAQNVLLLVLVYPVVKCVHELGHAYATKVWGGEVHEFGVMLLVLMPVPYLDASASSAFPEKWRRAAVGAAGVAIEAALAAVAVLVWAAAEPGLVRAVAFNVALICGVSTLLFNGNPLLRFDGYYVLCDLAEIPNLAGRANRYLLYLIERHGFGVDVAASPVTARGERIFFVVYALAAFAYRMTILLAITLFVATQFLVVGVALAAVAVISGVAWPLLKGAAYVAGSPRLNGRRRRAAGLILAVSAILLALLFAVPLPYATMAEGVVWVGEQAAVRAETAGLAASISVPSGTAVEAGRELVVVEDPLLIAQKTVLEHQIEELRLRLDTVLLSDLVQANMLREQIRSARGQLDKAEAALAGLIVRAPRAGRFLIAGDTDLPGRFVKRGDVLGYVLGEGEPIIRVVVRQADVDLVRRHTTRIAVRLAGRTGIELPATLLREVPGALAELPHLALATTGGGSVILDPASADRPRPIESLFHFVLAAPPGTLPDRLGGRVHVRFAHQPEPVAYRLLRASRQLFLRQFGV